ncbi:MAG: phosphoglucosamine mutase [Proteobacteria bacterium]|nr:phosphoglucosamine mutase [Pseudomonadota bacterium]
MRNSEGKIFGTDGVRGRANQYPMTPETVLKLAQAVAQEFQKNPGNHGIVIGKDTRLSGYMVESALTAGFISMGMNVFLVGPLPTPAISMLTRSLRADLGVMISASHNPAEDNGLKFFGPDGFKLDDAVQDRIESYFKENKPIDLASPLNLGHARRIDDAQGRYIEFVKNAFPKGLRLDGLKIVVDCAHGAAYKVAPTVFWELGAEVIAIGNAPNGVNINQHCGAMHPEFLIETLKAHQADIGIALDGDADRVIMVDEKGTVINGDFLLAAIATSWSEKNKLQKNGIITTIMSNLGLEHYLESQGLHLVRTNVGDRYVSEYMRLHGYNVGGEQSGHIILGEAATTGDGLMAALQVLALLVEDQKPASYLSSLFTPYPQILKNVKGVKKSSLKDSSVISMIQNLQDSLGNNGRLIVRPSGTEDVIRIMAEGEDPCIIEGFIEDLIEVLEEKR